MIEITDGELSAVFDGGNYSISSWSPAVARRVNGRYQDVRETIRFNVNGDVQNRLRLLQQLADRANRFAQGERINPVVIKWTLSGSSTVFVAMIVGVFSFTLPVNFSLTPVVTFLDNATMQFDRRGQWLTPDPSSLVVNGGFEDWAGDPLRPGDWDVDIDIQGSEIQVDIERSDTKVFEGEYSAKFTATGNGAIDSAEIIVSQVIDVPEGDQIQVIARVFVESLTTETGELDLSIIGANTTGQLFGDQKGEWITFNRTVTAGPSGVQIVFSIFESTIVTPANTVIYVDAVEVYNLSATNDAGDVAEVDDVPNGDVARLVFVNGVEPFLSPTSVRISNYAQQTGVRGFAIIANGTGKITQINATDLAVSGPFSKVNDSANYARGNDVLRYIPLNVALLTLDFGGFTSALATTPRLALFANMRNNSASVSFTVDAQVSAPGYVMATQPIIVAGMASPFPRWFYLGEVTLAPRARLIVRIQASGASGSFDINTFTLVDTDTGRIVEIDPARVAGTAAATDILIDHNSLTALEPVVQMIQDNEVTPWSAAGDIFIPTDAAVIEGLLLFTDSAGNNWRQIESAAVRENNWILSRLPGRLSPE